MRPFQINAVHSRIFICRQFCSAQTTTHKRWTTPHGKQTKLQIFNPITKELTPFITNRGRTVNWYACGPTVYDDPHIGHALTYVRLDTMRRILQNFFNLNVTFMMGITDIDDKIISKSQQTGQAASLISQKYESKFFESMNRLHIEPPTITRRVTESITSIIEFIELLIKKNKAYITDKGNVYFMAENDPYTQTLRNISLQESSTTAAYVASSVSDKRHRSDFALWKAAKPGEDFWKSPWSNGRPGWHIECSVMASEVFGEKIDIHSGGEDLVFPHHSNELSQSNCYHDCTQWVNYWIHTGLLNTPHQDKMSKSLGNTTSIDQLLDKYTPNQFRLFCLLKRYRSQVEFSEVHMARPVKTLKQINEFLHNSKKFLNTSTAYGDINSILLERSLEVTEKGVLEALCHDFDTETALRLIINLIHVGNIELCKSANKRVRKARSLGSVSAISQYIEKTLSQLGFKLSQAAAIESEASDVLLKQIVNSSVEFRNKVRNFSLGHHLNTTTSKDVRVAHIKEHSAMLESCDQMRSEFTTLANVEIRDVKDKSVWKFIEGAIPKSEENSIQEQSDSSEQ